MGHIVVPQFIDKASIRDINQALEECNQRPENKELVAEGKNSNTLVIDTREAYHIVGDMFNMVYKVNEEVFGFDLFSRWPETFNLNTYLSDQEYPWHKDATNPNVPHDIKLTMLVNLSEEKCTGGEFELFTGKAEHVVEMDEPGTLCVFISPTYHRVRPVTQGSRKTLSAWFKGLNWR